MLKLTSERSYPKNGTIRGLTLTDGTLGCKADDHSGYLLH